MLLEGKTAVIYGAGGGIGRGVAPTFAREGARVVLAGRTRAPLEAVAAEVAAAGGEAEVAEVDALDEAAVDAHLDGVVERHGRVNVSFNLVARGDVQGAPLVNMPVNDILRPVETGLRANVVTARAAARRMAERGGGVIMSLTSGSGTDAATRQAASAGGFHMGGTGPADAATEAFLRYLAAEMGPRACGCWASGPPACRRASPCAAAPRTPRRPTGCRSPRSRPPSRRWPRCGARPTSRWWPTRRRSWPPTGPGSSPAP